MKNFASILLIFAIILDVKSAPQENSSSEEVMIDQTQSVESNVGADLYSEEEMSSETPKRRQNDQPTAKDDDKIVCRAELEIEPKRPKTIKHIHEVFGAEDYEDFE